VRGKDGLQSRGGQGSKEGERKITQRKRYISRVRVNFPRVLGYTVAWGKGLLSKKGKRDDEGGLK